MSTEVVGFEKIKDTYESCPDFENIFIVLRDSLTIEVDNFLLQDGGMYPSHLLERIFSLEITRWEACWKFYTKQNN